ncbi:MAG TPA: hypothetical protein VMT86_17580 [Bryobacteraceae bacterium]|nr:hypothetical protein [Bryobacteraceae bacterium]
MNTIVPTLACPQPMLHPGMQGMERVGVDDVNGQLTVTFFRTITLPAESYLLQPGSYVLTGSQRLFPKVISAAIVPLGSPPVMGGPTQVLLQLDAIGDFSVYTLTVSGPDIDPLFASRQLRFRLGCDERFDCRPPAAAAPSPAQLPVAIDYLAKDYSSFRQALLDFASSRFPNWSERSEADIGMMLVELFAYTADRLSYMQDRVAGEAYLSTATQRRSVAEHLELIGYRMDDGASAYTWLQFQVNEVHEVTTAFQVSNHPKSQSDAVLVFEPLAGARLDPAHNNISLYTWGNTGCCLPQTAVAAVLAGEYPMMAAGDYILFDDGTNRDIVRLTSTPQIGTIDGDTVTSIAWLAATPLHSEYCADKAVVRGNLVVATHGESVDSPDDFAAPDPSPQRLRLTLTQYPLAHLDQSTLALVAPLGPAPPASLPAAGVQSVSTLTVTVGDDPEPWQEVWSLLGSAPDATAYRVEIADDGEANLVFGQGGSGTPGEQFGLRPSAGSTIQAVYRVGGGAVGNLPADSLVEPHPSALDALTWLDSVTNPLPATGGRDLETRDHARRYAPHLFQTPLVAVTAQDYELAAQQYTDADGQNPVQRAKASFRWTGSWLTVTLGVELRGNQPLTADLDAALVSYLDTRHLAGYDLEITGANYIPVDLIVSFCPASTVDPSSVQQQIEIALSNGPLPGGGLGFFAPDNFSFGDSLYVSRLFAAIMKVPGVESARITRLARLHSANPDGETVVNLGQGYMAVAPDQIIRLDNDRNFPENGALSVQNLEAAV